MTLSLPFVWSDDVLRHEPGAEIWLGISTPGTERLYSGVANSTASTGRIRLRNSAKAAGRSVSSSWL